MKTKSTHRWCGGMVFDGRGAGGYGCAVGAKIKEGGKWWCHVHAPSRVRARREKREAEWKRKSNERDKRWAAAEAREERRDLAETLLDYLDSLIAVPKRSPVGWLTFAHALRADAERVHREKIRARETRFDSPAITEG